MSLTLPPPVIEGIPQAEPERARTRAWRHILVGSDVDAPWVRPALIGLLLATGVLYVWNLGASGWANSFYSAAVQAGTKSWKAFFFGSSDAANSITVDKPPASLWVMELSARLFGVNAWSILVPQALEGVAAVGVLYATVRRWFTPAAGLLAGAVLALTPVAALMFRFNNPDALLTLLLVVGAYAMVRAVEVASPRWLALAMALVGLGFLTKMLQALCVVPAFGLVYLIAAPTTLRRRLSHLVVAAVALVVSAGWWVAIVQLIPAADRPYIGGSQHNSLLNLIFGYNGFGRLTGNETGSVGGGGGAGGRWGPTGWLRMFGSEFGGQVSWLLPASLILLAAGLAVTLRARRTDRTRAAYALWGGWLVVTAAVFSLGQGIIHPYYSVALAPAIAALVGMGATAWWVRRRTFVARLVLGVTLAATAIWSAMLLGRTPNWQPWLHPLVLGGGLALAALIVLLPTRRRVASFALAGAAIAVALAGPTAYTLATVTTPESGAIPAAGPPGASQMGFGRPGGGGPGGGAFPGGGAGGFARGGTGAFAGGAAGGLPAAGGGTGGVVAGGAPTGATGGGGGIGGLLNGSSPSTALVSALEQNASQFTWIAATVGANQAAGYQLATGDPVMPIGGFNGTDPSPTLAQFQQYVAAGRIHWFIAGGAGGGPGGLGGQGGSAASTSSQITSWVTSHFTATTVGGVTLYDLSSPVST